MQTRWSHTDGGGAAALDSEVAWVVPRRMQRHSGSHTCRCTCARVCSVTFACA